MPYTYGYGPLLHEVSTYKPSGNKQTWVEYPSSRWEKVVSDSVKRSKPADLFGNATQQNWSDYASGTSLGWFENSAYIFQYALSRYVSNSPIKTSPIVNRDALNLRLLNKIKSQNLNLAQSMAEYRQTCDMFAGAAADVIKTFRSLRSGRLFADFVRILQEPRNKKERRIANRWLEYQYGLSPLLSDIYGLSAQLAAKINEGFMVWARERSSESLVHETTRSFQGPDSQWYSAYHYETHKVQTRVTARFKISDESVRALSQTGLSNPALLGWELIPYSFVIDWLIPVGEWLSALDALNGTKELRVNYGNFTEIIVEVSGAGGTTWRRDKHKHREATKNSIGMPRLEYKPSESLKSVLNGLALLTQLRR